MKKCLVPLRFESGALKFFLSKSLGLTLVKNIRDVLFCDKMFAQNQDMKYVHEREELRSVTFVKIVLFCSTDERII